MGLGRQYAEVVCSVRGALALVFFLTEFEKAGVTLLSTKKDPLTPVKASLSRTWTP